LAAAIEDKFSVESDLVRLGNGIFNVYVDGKKIFDKYEEDRFPEESEILEAIESMRNGG
jgi:selT/selW/selH-like putative selenoprotein